MKIFLVFWATCVLWWSAFTFPAQAQGPTIDPAFLPFNAVASQGSAVIIGIVVRQPDGKLVVTGNFSSINGRAAVNMARLLPDGQVDTTFNAAPIEGGITSIALQADGKLLLAGRFTNVGGQSRIGIARLLPNGTLDPSFLSPLGSTPSFSSFVEKVVVQPGRGILVLGYMITLGTSTGAFHAARLLESTGALDSTFQPGFTTFGTNDVLVQPNGNLVFSGYPNTSITGQDCNVWATLPDGALDPTFTPLPGIFPRAFGLTSDPATGKLYVILGTSGPTLDFEPVRLLPNGLPDPSFSTVGAFVPSPGPSGVTSLAVQPNGRLLLGGGFPPAGGGFVGSWRLLPSGAADPSYVPTNGPDADVYKVLVQPDGALLFAGGFQQVSGLPIPALTRLLDPNVLSAREPSQCDDDLLAWPVPAREVLHLRLPAARMAREVALLDALGRVVRRQEVPAGQPTPDLSTAGLPPGGYLLRVVFANGSPAYRRVAVE